MTGLIQTYATAFQALDEAVGDACKPGDYERWTADDYDSSVEIYGVGADDTVDLAPLWAIGARLVWIHRHPYATRASQWCECPCVCRPKATP